MKVKEILEVLNADSEKATLSELAGLLDNIGIENADEETDIEINVLKKLSRKYNVEFKAVKTKKQEKPRVRINVKEKKEKKESVDPSGKEEAKKEIKEITEKEAKPSPFPVPIQAKTGKKEVKKVAEEEKRPAKEPSKAFEKVKAKPVKKEVKEPAKEPSKAFEKVKAGVKPKAFEEAEQFRASASKTEETPKTSAALLPAEPELTRVYDDKYNEYVRREKQYTRIKNIHRKSKTRWGRQSNLPGKELKENTVYYMPGMTAGNLASIIGVSSGEIVRKLVNLGYMVSVSQPIDREVLEYLADDYGFELKDKIDCDITKFEELVIEDEEENLRPRPPIVTIMGHVDHGKTTLLDTIRNSRVAMGEAGGITQHIGAYQVDAGEGKITFIDTPGHEAFTEMRARGAMVTDIVVLVVAADDGVMPQTKEAIDHAKAAGVPIIVAVNKMDKPQANPERIMEELSALDLVPSEWGGDTEYVCLSALTGRGVGDLLDTIIMVSEIKNYRANPNRLGTGTVIEAKLTKGRGPVATFLVKNGTVKIGDPVVVGNVYGKIRAMQDENKEKLTSAGPSKAAEITGLESLPQAGDRFMVFEDEKTAKLVCEERNKRAMREKNKTKSVSLASMFENMDGGKKEIRLIIRSDVQGSSEALLSSLRKTVVEGVGINVIRSGAGMITDNDISLAVASSSVIIGFNVRPSGIIVKQAREQGVEIRQYDVIYKFLEDIEAAMKGMLDPVYREKKIGELEVRKIFTVSRIGTIAGCYVTEGVVTRNSEVRVFRNGSAIYTGRIGSLQHEKDEAKEIKQGFECGLTIQNHNDIMEGDIIETFIMEEV